MGRLFLTIFFCMIENIVHFQEIVVDPECDH